MKGNIVEDCSCRDSAGKLLHAACPDRTKRGHVRYGYRVSLPAGPDGKRRQPRVGGFTKRSDAERALREALGALDRGTYTQRTKLLTVTYLREWLTGKAALRPSTRRSYGQHIEGHLAPAFGAVELVALRAADVARMNSKLIAQGLSASSVRRVNATLRAALHDAVKADLVPRNVASLVDLPTTTRRDVQVWTGADVGSFLDHCEDADERLSAMFHVIATRGLRRGEACGLRWQDVDLAAGSLRVVQQHVQIGYAVIVGEPKTKGSARVVSLDGATIDALRQHRARQSAERLAWGPAWADTGLCFTREDGRAVHPEYVTRHFGVLAAGAGLPKIRLHDLRHSAASMALAAGVPLKAVSVQLGHSSITITADIYSHVSPAMAHDSAERTAAMIPRRSRPA